jgi:hypothetical protein
VIQITRKIGAGEGARTLDPDLGKVGVAFFKHLMHLPKRYKSQYIQSFVGIRRVLAGSRGFHRVDHGWTTKKRGQGGEGD